jgi:hypothetical protein
MSTLILYEDKNREEEFVLNSPKFDNYKRAFMSQDDRPDWDLAIENDDKTYFIEVKKQLNQAQAIFEFCEINDVINKKWFINENIRFTNGEWFKTGILTSNAEYYYIINNIYTSNINTYTKKAVVKIYDEKKLEAYKNIIPAILDYDETDNKIIIKDQNLNEKIKEFALELRNEYVNRLIKKDLTPFLDQSVINSYNYNVELYITCSDFEKGTGKWDLCLYLNDKPTETETIVYSVGRSKDKKYTHPAPKILNDFKGLKTESNGEINVLFKNKNRKSGAGEYSDSSSCGDSSGSSSESEEERKDLRTFFNKLTNKIKSMKK